MSLAPRAGESVTRLIDRRNLLRRAAMTTFGLVAAVAVKGLHADRASAISCIHHTTSCGCSPPHTRYCTVYNSSYCSGSACAGGCSYNYLWGYSDTACWRTATCCYSGGCLTGYYECCDCSCSGVPDDHACGCNQFVTVCNSGHSPSTHQSQASAKPDCLVCPGC